MSSELLQPRRTMHGVILDASNVFMSCPVVVALVDVITHVPRWKITAEVMIQALINLLVIAMVGSMSPTNPMSALIMNVVMGPMITLGAIVITVIPFSSVIWRRMVTTRTTRRLRDAAAVAVTRGGGRISDSLSSLDQLGHLSHGGYQVHLYVRPNVLVFWRIRQLL